MVVSDKKTKVLVTGGCGFIGRHLVAGLLDAAYDVVVVDKGPTADDWVSAFIAGRKVTFHRFDIVREPFHGPHWVDILNGVDTIYHLAAIPSVSRSIENPWATHEANASGTLQVLLAAKELGVRRFVYASSSSVYGDTPTLPKRESMPTYPASPYAVSKLAGEHYCRVFQSMGLETVSLRYFNVYGQGQDPESEYAAVIPRWIKAVQAGEKAIVYGDGKQSRDFTYVKDVVRATILAGESDAQGVYNVGTGEAHTLIDVLRTVGRACHVTPKTEFEDARVGDVRHSLASISLAGQHFGYAPAWQFNMGIRDMVG